MPWAFLTPRPTLSDENFFQVSFPLYPYRVSRGRLRISLSPIKKKTKSYRNPIAVALGFKEALDNGKYRNQTALAKSLNYTPARISQFLRLLNLPESLQKDILKERIRPSERGLRGLMAGTINLPRT